MTQNKSVEEKSQSEEWGAWKFVSEMLDTPHPDETLAKCGIYNTSKCYEQIHDFVVEQKEKVRQTSQEREREMFGEFMKFLDIQNLEEKPKWGKTKGHGSCCYCQECFRFNDECVCEYNRNIKELKLIAQKYNITLPTLIKTREIWKCIQEKK